MTPVSETSLQWSLEELQHFVLSREWEGVGWLQHLVCFPLHFLKQKHQNLALLCFCCGSGARKGWKGSMLTFGCCSITWLTPPHIKRYFIDLHHFSSCDKKTEKSRKKVDLLAVKQLNRIKILSNFHHIH